MAKSETPATRAYILKAGQEHNGIKDGERHTFKGGDEVLLNERQATAFKDKFDSKEELALRARVANGGNVSREEALAALGITEEEYSKIAPSEETIKQPDGDEPKGEPIKVAPDSDDDKKDPSKEGSKQAAPAQTGTAGAAAKK